MTPLLTRKDVAAALRVSARTVDNWCAEGLLPFIALPGGKRFHAEAIQAFIRLRSFATHTEKVKQGA